MSFQDNYLQDYILKIPLRLDYIENILLPNYETFSSKVLTTWKQYNTFLLGVRLVLDHPNYNVDISTSTSEILYDKNCRPRNISPFNGVSKQNFFRFIYDNIALTNLKKEISLSLAPNNNIVDNLTIIDGQSNTVYSFLLSSNDETDLFTFEKLDKITIYSRIKTNFLYSLTDPEQNFIRFIIKVLNYFYNLLNSQIDDNSIQTNHLVQLDSDVILTILKENYLLNDKVELANTSILTTNLIELAYFTLPYIKKLSETFNSLGIPNYFLGITIFELLMEEKKQLLIIIANYILPETNTPLCEINTPLFTPVYLQ